MFWSPVNSAHLSHKNEVLTAVHESKENSQVQSVKIQKRPSKCQTNYKQCWNHNGKYPVDMHFNVFTAVFTCHLVLNYGVLFDITIIKKSVFCTIAGPASPMGQSEYYCKILSTAQFHMTPAKKYHLLFIYIYFNLYTYSFGLIFSAIQRKIQGA